MHCQRCGAVEGTATIVFGTRAAGDLCPSCQVVVAQELFAEHAEGVRKAMAESGVDVSPAQLASAALHYLRAGQGMGPNATPEEIARRFGRPSVE